MLRKALVVSITLLGASCAATTDEAAPVTATAPPPLSTASDQSVTDNSQTGSQERDIQGASAEEVVEQYGPSQVGGIGDLLVAPTRIVLGDEDRFAQLSLVNIGNQTATYRISFSELQMTPEGELRTIEDPEKAFMPASEIVRYSPRQIILEPNVAQTVRLQVRRPADLPDGEYRSHLLFRAVPPPELVEPDQEEDAERQGLSVNLIPLYGITIPVIIRHGESFVTPAITDLELVEGTGDAPDVLKMKIERDGNRSVYGSIRVTHHAPGGTTRVVGRINGLGVYTPLPYRAVEVPLDPGEAGTIEGGYLEVELRQGEGGGDELLARARLELP